MDVNREVAVKLRAVGVRPSPGHPIEETCHGGAVNGHPHFGRPGYSAIDRKDDSTLRRQSWIGNHMQSARLVWRDQ
jgi:hypothetical protein